MDALEALHTRQSISQLGTPGPSAEQLEQILKAGLRANDHARLRPWRFLLIEGSAREKLGQLFVQVKREDQPGFSPEDADKLAGKPLRAPLIITVIACVQAHDKVPELEQIISAGAAAQLMMVAAHAQNLGAVWRTGALAYDRRVCAGLGLADSEQIVGFLYMGTPQQQKPLAQLDSRDFVQFL